MPLSSLMPEAEVLRQIADRSLAVFFLYNLKEDRFEYVSPAFEEVWGREEAHLNDRLPWLLETVYPEDLPLLLRCFAQLQTNAFRQFVEFRLVIGIGELCI